MIFYEARGKDYTKQYKTRAGDSFKIPTYLDSNLITSYMPLIPLILEKKIIRAKKHNPKPWYFSMIYPQVK